MNIGPITLNKLCRLAPMAGISNIPFRLLCKELGSSLTTSEEISASGLVYSDKRTNDLARYLASERPIAMQLVGSDPEQLATAAKILVDNGADIIDLNMGCPVKKVVKTGAGAALMRDPLECAKVFRTMRAAITVPFTIKIRGGWDIENVNAPEIAQIAESEGVDAICVHPRTRSQQYSGLAPWKIIQLVVDAVNIPVTGNGDVRSYDDALRMQRETGCQSVMIGRGALGKPWVFDAGFAKLSPAEQHRYSYQVIQRHFYLIEEYMHKSFAVIQMKKHLAWYIAGKPGAAKARNKVFTLKEIQEVWDFFEAYWEDFEAFGAGVDSSPAVTAEAIRSASLSTASGSNTSPSASICAATSVR